MANQGEQKPTFFQHHHQEQAVVLNNKAVSLIECGHYNLALQLLSESLRNARRAIILHQSEKEQGPQQSDGTPKEEKAAIGGPGRHDDDDSRLTSSWIGLDRFLTLDTWLEQIQEKNDGKFMIAAHPIEIKSPSVIINNSNAEGSTSTNKNNFRNNGLVSSSLPSCASSFCSSSELSAIIIFNMALACHLNGLQQQHKQNVKNNNKNNNKAVGPLFQKACKLYQAAWKLVNAQQQDQQQQETSLLLGSKFFSIAIANNLAHVISKVPPTSTLRSLSLGCLMQILIVVNTIKEEQEGMETSLFLRGIYNNIFPGALKSAPAA